MDYYDVVLTLIPTTFVLTTVLLLTLGGVSITMATAGGSIIPVGIVGHAMFARGPTTSTVLTISR